VIADRPIADRRSIARSLDRPIGRPITRSPDHPMVFGCTRAVAGMALALGTRIGPYEVSGVLGAGGMGEVYRARDTRLNRDVAIKVLPAPVGGDADRVARFAREAQLLAALNHPHIAQVHGLEERDGITALVMELVTGEDLSIQLRRGPIDVADALPIARQIADALEAAHELGIIHRDLKPANIKIRPDGVVKVLDFGLAKALDATSPATADAMNQPTLTSPAMTRAGMILGTAAYMAPEQARGRVVDRRADIWAFGVVLFEMLTGRRAFPGDDVTDTILAVVSKEPEWNSLPAATPPGLRRLITRCLKKDPKARLRDIGEARVVLDELISGAPEVVPGPVAAAAPLPSSTRPRVLTWVLAAASLVLATAWVTGFSPWRGASPSSAGLQLTPLSFEQGGQLGAVWSPDGKGVAFGARQKDTALHQVYVRYLNSPVATKITETAAGVTSLIEWTTAGKILFASANRVWSVSPVGGEPQLFADVPSGLQRAGSGVVSVARDGTAMAELLRDADGTVTLWTSALPARNARVYDASTLVAKASFSQPALRFSPDGKQILLFWNRGAGEEAWLMPYPADAANPPRRILRGTAGFNGTPAIAWMPDNRHVILSMTPGDSARQLYLADTVDDTFTVFSSGTTAQTSPAVSPDGTRLVFVEQVIDRDIVTVDLTTAAVTPLIATQRSEQMPHWAARAAAMVYQTDRNGEPQIWLHTDGQPDRPVVTPNDFPPGTTRGFLGPSLSPDATRVIYQRLELGAGEAGGLYISAVAGGPPVKLVEAGGHHGSGSWSPDGNWFVYQPAEGARLTLNKVKTTGGATPEVLTTEITHAPWVQVWSPANDWILYPRSGAQLISPDGGTTRQLSAKTGSGYAFSADGRTVYGIRILADDRDHIELFSISVADGAEKRIGLLAREYLPAASFTPALRLSLTPDGRSLTYARVRTTANLWLMSGLESVRAR
jgi:serine/threonine protein kinase/Tol biopolymer transport system component